MYYRFPEKLREGIIKARPNRFIMLVKIGGKIEECHCPSTGRIGSIHFQDIPCLVSKSRNPSRRTRFTVEAISLDSPRKKSKSWIGVNQTAANDYFFFFLKRGAFGKMVGGGEHALRERKIGRSRIDFEIGDEALVELKTMLMDLPCEAHPQYREHVAPFVSFHRLVKHFGELAKALASEKKKRALIVLCYLYDAKPFTVPVLDSKTAEITRAARAAARAGVENWQVNFVINGEGVRLKRFFKLELF